MKYVVSTVMVLFSIINSVIVTAQTSNDEDNFQGDRLSFPVPIKGRTPTGTAPDTCIPAGTALRGLSKADANKKINVLQIRTWRPGFDPVEDGGCDEGDEIIKKRQALEIDISAMDELGGNRYGFTYGALVVPYKYHFSGSKSFEGNSTVGPFLGYRFDQNGLGLGIKLVAFVGGAAIRVNRTDENGENNDETLAGFSYGVGALGRLKNDFQLGIVFGEDRVSDGSDYEDNGKLWGAVALGFSFAN